MGWIKSVAREVYGLFVDDVSFAVAIVVWVVIAGVALPHARWAGPVLCAGLAGILVESVWRFARGSGR
jgi:hypothetical protein